MHLDIGLRGADEVPSALAALALVWGALTARHLLAPWVGADAAVLVTFAGATVIALATRVQPLPSAEPARPIRRARPLPRGGRLWLLGLITGLVALLAAAAAAPWFGLAAPAPALSGRATTWLSIVVLAPVFEELLYRERLLPAFTRSLGFVPAAIVTSALFAVPHIHPGSVLGAFCTGLILAGAMHLTGSIGLCIGLHMGWNLGACLGTGWLSPISLRGAEIVR